MKKMWQRFRMSDEQGQVLISLLKGSALRSHRDIDGNKQFLLHDDAGQTAITMQTVETLRRNRLIETNHKFPSATFLLTGKGRELAQQLSGEEGANSVGASNFVSRN